MVQHAVILAEKLGISPLVISMTIVAFGTSAPELVVSINALYNGYSDLVLGNIIGSNIANMLLVLPVAALIYPIVVANDIVKREGGMMIGATVLFAGLCMTGGLATMAGIVLLLGLAGFMVYSFGNPDQDEDNQDAPKSTSVAISFLAIVLSLCSLAFGSRLFIEGAVDLSRLIGVSEAVIGLTVVAVGTAAPELVTVVIAAWQRQTDIIIGNIIGSNIFNLLAIGGVSAAFWSIPVGDHFLQVDLPILLGVSIALVVLALARPRIGRISGIVMLGGYAAYTDYLL